MTTIARLIEVALAILIVTQILLPLIFDTPMWPMLRRRKQGQLMSKLEHAKQDLAEDELEEEIERLQLKHETDPRKWKPADERKKDDESK